MPKIIDYPRASLRNAIQLAEAVDGFAGSCSAELAAEQLGKKITGAFSAQIGAAVKYGLIDSKGGKLTVTPLYREYKLAYTPEEAASYLREALLSPPMFKEIYGKFKGQKLPIVYFEKMLIREFGVSQDMGSRVAGYFLDGAKQVGLLNNENFLVPDLAPSDGGELQSDEKSAALAVVQTVKVEDEDVRQDTVENKGRQAPNPVIVEDFWFNIRGPGMNFSIEIKDADDLEIVQVMLRKVEKMLKSNDSSTA